MNTTPKPNDPMAEHALVSSQEKRKRGRPSKAARLHYERPTVAYHIASVVIKHAMAFDDAVRELMPQIAGNDRLVGWWAKKLEHDAPLVKQAMEEQLTKFGLDDESKSSFVKEMWRWLRGDDKFLKGKAASILGKGFIGEKVVTTRPENLPISDFEDITKRLGLSESEGGSTKKELSDAVYDRDESE